MNITHIQSVLISRYTKIVFIILPLMYVVGFIGLMLPQTQAYFKLLSAFNLWVSFAFLSAFHQDFQKSFIYFIIIAFCTGFFVEVLGVHTGIIFGKYWYGATLGTKLFEVPIVIGANWFILVYSAGIIAEKVLSTLKASLYKKILVAFITATLMVSLDILIEPIAIKLDFWQWDANIIPLQNFIAWFIIAFILALYFTFTQFKKTNPLAFLIFSLQSLFFLLHTFFNT